MLQKPAQEKSQSENTVFFFSGLFFRAVLMLLCRSKSLLIALPFQLFVFGIYIYMYLSIYISYSVSYL